MIYGRKRMLCDDVWLIAIKVGTDAASRSTYNKIKEVKTTP